MLKNHMIVDYLTLGILHYLWYVIVATTLQAGVAMKPVQTIAQILPSPKYPQTHKEKSCIVYQVRCSDCEFFHIGQTKRDLKSRLAEHKRAIKFQRPEQFAL